MPSTYLQYSQDFDGDGRRDIWSSQPDVFASVAYYLREHGWTEGRLGPRGQGADSLGCRDQGAAASRGRLPRRTRADDARPLKEWRKLGLRTSAARRLPAATLDASIVTDGTRYFLVYKNYEALLAYNCAHELRDQRRDAGR